MISHLCPGFFIQVFDVPSDIIDPHGVETSAIIPKEKLKQIRLLVEQQDADALLQLLFRMEESNNAGSSINGQTLSRAVFNCIWNRGGDIRVEALSRENVYSARFLQQVTTRNIGLLLKRLCKQICFLHILHRLT